MIGGCGPTDQPQDEIYELVTVAPGVWATVVHDGINPSQYSASLIVVRTDHVLVVDSRHDYESADNLVATIRTLTDLPVRYLVNTHWHGDHVQGNARFRERFPEVQIIGGATTGADIFGLGRTRLDEEIVRVEGRIAAATEWLETGNRGDGTPLTDEEREALPEQIQAARDYLAAREEIQLSLPNIAVDSELRLADAEPVVSIIHLGPAHTRGDVVVHLPDLRVLALGDLIEDGFPYLGDGSPAGWADALYRASKLDADVFLGAHGPVLTDSSMLFTQKDFARAVVAAARAGVQDGLTPEETFAALDMSDYFSHFTRRLEGSTPAEKTERFEAFVRELLDLAIAEAEAEATDTGSGR
jgi:glyoxylase-like metal-dependent hydrolase (beta-lactamase superfamily II)